MDLPLIISFIGGALGTLAAQAVYRAALAPGRRLDALRAAYLAQRATEAGARPQEGGPQA